jgi:hypothetical protein
MAVAYPSLIAGMSLAKFACPRLGKSVGNCTKKKHFCSIVNFFSKSFCGMKISCIFATLKKTVT